MIASILLNVCLILGLTVIIAAILLIPSWSRWKDGVADNPVTRCGEGLRPFVEACGNGKIEKMAKELLAKVDEGKRVTPREAIDHVLSDFQKREAETRARLDAEARETSLARQWQDGMSAEYQVEDKVGELWPDLVDHCDTDPYDNSLEVYFHSDDPALGITQEQAQAIADMGFSQVWLNYLDGTELYAGLWKTIQIFERKKVNSPHWSRERMMARRDA